MSLVDKKVTSRLVEKKLPGKATLNLTSNIMDQIDYLHKIVGGVEWSGVLVYRIVEGSIEDYENLEIEVLEILPMDVGTSGYTEYELDSSDEYTFNNLCDRVMMDDNLKIGHIHTHHNMNCFFSGTDTQELHDNAGNHNYYLSLIVNFKDYTNWCAKIALVGEEAQEGRVTNKFKGTNGDIIEKVVEVSKATDILYTIDIDIKYEASEEEEGLTEFQQRVLELNRNKGRRFSTPSTPGYQWGGPQIGSYQRNPVTGVYEKVTVGQGRLFPEGEEEEEKEAPNYKWWEKKEEKKVVEKERVKINVADASIRGFAHKLISVEMQPTGLFSTTLNNLDKAFEELPEEELEASKELYVEGITLNYDRIFTDHFKTTPTDTSKDFVTRKVIKILEAYEHEFTFLQEVIEELTLNYVLEDVEE